MSNKRVDRLEVGANFPQAPNDEVVWIDVETNNINRYDETTSEWISVGGTAGTFEDPILKDNVRFSNSSDSVRLQIEHGGTGVVRIHAPEDDLALRSANDILLYAGDDGPGNVYIGWGDATITPDSSNRVATMGDILSTVVPTAIKDDNDDDFITFERTFSGTARIGTPQDDLSLRSARDITLFAGNDGPGNVYIGWGDAVYTPDSPNKVATVGDLGVYPVTEITASASFTASFDHVGKTLYNVSGENVTCSVLLNADEYIPVGSEIKFVNDNSSGFFFDIASEGITLVGEGQGFSNVNILFWLPSNGYATLLKVATDNWILSGIRIND